MDNSVRFIPSPGMEMLLPWTVIWGSVFSFLFFSPVVTLVNRGLYAPSDVCIVVCSRILLPVHSRLELIRRGKGETIQAYPIWKSNFTCWKTATAPSSLRIRRSISIRSPCQSCLTPPLKCFRRANPSHSASTCGTAGAFQPQDHS